MLLLADSSLEHDPISKLELDEAKDEVKMEPVEVYKEGMVVPPREDGRPPEPPEGFTIHTTESGVMVLRRKRQRNLQKLGKMEGACCCYFWTFSPASPG
jgi:histone-lysine N-methyltransferase MLL3